MLNIALLKGISSFFIILNKLFWGVCELSMILCSFSANGWDCFPVLLFVWHGAYSPGVCWPLGGAGSWHWVGALLESSRRLTLCGAGRSLGVQCPELGSPTSEAQAWHQAGAPGPCQPHGLKLWNSTLQRQPFGCAKTYKFYKLCF